MFHFSNRNLNFFYSSLILNIPTNNKYTDQSKNEKRSDHLINEDFTSEEIMAYSKRQAMISKIF